MRRTTEWRRDDAFDPDHQHAVALGVRPRGRDDRLPVGLGRSVGRRPAAALPDARSLRADLGRLHVLDPLETATRTRSTSPSASPTCDNISEGEPALASAKGTVSTVYTTANGEHRVFIDHGGGWTTAYIHLESLPPLTVGQKVAQGEMVGRISNSGADVDAPALPADGRRLPGADPVQRRADRHARREPGLVRHVRHRRRREAHEPELPGQLVRPVRPERHALPARSTSRRRA